MNILGINVYHGDASATLIQDGKLIAAAEEERFNRIKHCAGLPVLATQFCLQQGKISPRDLKFIAISRRPLANSFKKALYGVSYALKNRAFLQSRAGTLGKVLQVKDDLAQALKCGNDLDLTKVVYVEHHLAHLSSSFFVSPFDQAALLSIDGFGDFVSTKIGVGHGSQIETLGQIDYPHSAGIVYTAACQYIGFQKYGDEGKVMGLAPYGTSKYLDIFRDMVQWDGQWRFELNLSYFHHHDGSLQMSWTQGSPQIGKIFSDRFIEKLGPARQPNEPITQHHMDIAASLQAMLEEIYFRILSHLYKTTKLSNLCLAGGVALNSVANGKIFLNSPFKELFIQPAAGDGGTSLGAAFYVWNQLLNRSRSMVMDNAYTGAEFSDAEIGDAIKAAHLTSAVFNGNTLYDATAHHIADGKIIGWFQGRAEFGPRALGNRSIVVDPRRPDMKAILNSRIKHREAFRPFAPSILAEHIAEYFEQSYPSPFMLMVYNVKPGLRAKVPAITHVDGSGRLQTVTPQENPRYYNLIKAFHKLTGVPLLLNTSFNENEPIVNTPEEAIHCFQKTKMDVLVLGNHLLTK